MVADQIARGIMEDSLPRGTLVGTVSELMSRYGVGQATLVEASRQLERQGVASLRRGVGGGLVVAGSPRSRVVHTISTYLELLPVTPQERRDAWRTLESQGVALGARSIGDEEIADLRAKVTDLRRAESPEALQAQISALHIAIADAGANEANALFMRVLMRLANGPLGAPAPSGDGQVERYEALVDAMVSGDESLAQHLVRLNIAGWEANLPEAPPSRARTAAGRSEDDKMGELTALLIRDDVARLGWPLGAKLGDEVELARRYAVSPRALREATSILELHGVVNPRRGRGGGLFIGAPDPAYTVSNAAAFLRYASIPPLSMFEVWRELLLRATQLCAERSSDEMVEGLRGLLARVRNALPADFRAATLAFYGRISRESGNRAISLLLDIGSAFMEGYPWRQPSASAMERTIACHQEVTDAIATADGGLARRRMLSYLNVMRSYYYS